MCSSDLQGALWEPSAAETLVRSLETRVGQPFEARKLSTDCNTLWVERRVLATAYAREVDGEIVVTFVVEREVEIYEGVDFVGNENLDQTTINSLLGLTVDRQVTRNEAEAMSKVLKTRYGRDGYANCNITLEERPAQDLLPGEAAPSRGPSRRLRFRIDEGPKVAIGAITFLGNQAIAADAL